MIPRDFITEWRKACPWIEDVQVRIAGVIRRLQGRNAGTGRMGDNEAGVHFGRTFDHFRSSLLPSQNASALAHEWISAPGLHPPDHPSDR